MSPSQRWNSIVAEAVLGLLVGVLSVMTSLAARAQDRTLTGAQKSAAAAGEAKRVALVIGNGNYRALPKLPNPRNDAQDVCEALKRLHFSVACAVDVATRRELRDLVRAFASRLQPGTLALFYYAGHGVQVRGENFLLPADMEARSSADIEDEALSLSYVLRTLEEARSAPNVVILDACRDNPFARPGESGMERGLARTEPPLGTVLVYATAPNKVAMDGNGRNGLFTKHLLANVAKPGLRIEELMQAVAEEVAQEARTVYRTEQVPFRSSSFAGNYCLAGCENPQFAERVEQIARQSEEAMRRIQSLTEENARLRTEAQQRADRIADMEARIGKLNEATTQSGANAQAAAQELQRLRAELDTARRQQSAVEQARQKEEQREREVTELRNRLAALQKQAGELAAGRERVRAAEQEQQQGAVAANARKDAELAELRSRLTALQAQTQQLDDYRREIQRLQRENEEKTRLLEQGQQQRRDSQPPADRRRSVVVPAF